MARFKPYDLNQTKMIPLSYADQVLEGSFEYALNGIVEEQLDLSVFDHRYHNDATGRLAYDPKVLLKMCSTATTVRSNPSSPTSKTRGMRRFTLRGQKKVSAQWKLFTMVHNIEKVAGAARR